MRMNSLLYRVRGFRWCCAAVLGMVLLSGCGATFHAGESAAPPQADGTAGGLGARALVINDADFFERWKLPEMPKVKLVTNARFNEQLYLVVLFSGAKASPGGQCDVVFDVALRGPDGSVVERRDAQVACSGTAPQPSLIQLARTRVQFAIGYGSPTGTYSFDGVVTDRVTGGIVLVHHSFTVDDASRTTR